jgi:hypothetical protein
MDDIIQKSYIFLKYHQRRIKSMVTGYKTGFLKLIILISLRLGLKKKEKITIYTFSGCAGRVWIILIGRLVTEGHEPRQVRKEAAISDFFSVKDRSRLCNFSFTSLPAGFFFSPQYFIS